MAEVKDTHHHHHVVEIPVTGEHQKQIISAIADHPLMEISESPGHLLLLKLWQREEDLSSRRIARKETRMDTLRREIFQLCLFFFTFLGLFFTILFTNSSQNNTNSCQKWWVPMVISLSTCSMMIFLVQMKLFRFWKVYEQMQRERSDNRALTRCIQELRMKGVSFDLSKEPGNVKRMKSSSVETKWKPITWCSKYFITFGLVLVTGLAVPVCRFMVCA